MIKFMTGLVALLSLLLSIGLFVAYSTEYEMTVNYTQAILGVSPETAMFVSFALFILIAFCGGAAGFRAAETVKERVQDLFALPFALLAKLLTWAETKPRLRRAMAAARHRFDFIARRLAGGVLVRLLERAFSRATDQLPERQALLRGDLEPLAEKMFPRDKYPQMWRTDIPDDVRRPLVIDGRLPNGELPADVVARNAIDREFMGKTLSLALIPAIFWFFATFWLYNPNDWMTDVPQGIKQFASQSASSPVVDPLAQLQGDYWHEFDYNRAYQDKLAELQEQAAVVVQEQKNRWFEPSTDAYIAAKKSLANGSNGTLTAFFFSICVFFGFLRWRILKATDEKVKAIKIKSKDAVVRYKYRSEQRSMADAAYQRQIDFVTGYDKETPTVSLGAATGAFYYRGALAGPERGNDFRMSLNDLSQHVLVYGGTGEGKTRSTIAPFVRQMLALRGEQISQGNPDYISLYATDAKAVLWRDIKAIADEMGQGRDVRVIGTGEGEYGVDLLDGVSPQLVADIISSVAKQARGSQGRGDDFWPNMASEVIRNTAIIAKAWSCTEDGYSYAQETGESPYSLVTIYELTRSTALMERALGSGLHDTMKDGLNVGPEILSVKKAINHELSYAVSYMINEWNEMSSNAGGTKAGITANITDVMSPFAVDSRLRERFASGSPAKLTRVPDLWGKINLVAISSLEHGIAGKIVNVMLKTLMYSEARRREKEQPDIGQREKMIFLADEFQDMITADMTGISDATFWNVARSTGVIGFIATQGISSLEQVIGKTAAENFALQMRTKIILRVEDMATINYAVSLAGKTIRSYSSDGDAASFAEQVAELDESPVSIKPVDVMYDRSSILKAIPAAFWHFLGAGAQPVRSEYAVEPSYAYTSHAFNRSKVSDLELMTREEIRGLGAETMNKELVDPQELQREEQLIREYYHSNNNLDDVLKVDDVITMGRGHAIAFVQRGGVTKADIIRLGA